MLPGYLCVVRTLRIPLRSRRKARRVAPSMFDIQLPFALEQCRCEIGDVRAAGSECLVSACAVRDSDLENFLSRLRESGLDPVWVFPEPLVLWRQALREKVFTVPGERALVHAARDRLTLVLGKGEQFEESFTQRLSTDYAADPALPVRLMQRAGVAIREWRVCGSETESFLRLWNEKFSGRKPPITVRAPDLFAARAAAAEPFNTGTSDINLRKGNFTHLFEHKRAARAIRRTAGCYILAGGLLIAGSLAARSLMRARESVLQHELRNRAEALTGYPPQPGMERLEAERALEAKTSDYAPFSAVFQPSPAVSLAHWLQKAHALDLEINALSLGRDRVEIRGFSRDWNAPERLRSALVPEFPEARLERREADATERVSYTITAQLETYEDTF